jgi:hypothetical protein
MSSPQNIVFNNLTFLQNLPNVLIKDISSSSQFSSLVARDYVEFVTYPAGKSFQGFLEQFQKVGSPFTTWEDFEASWKAYTGFTDNFLLTGFMTSYRNILNMGPVDSAPIDDWSDLGAQGVTDEQLISQFKQSFSQFLAQYQYQADGSAGGTTPLDTFFSQWVTNLAVTADIKASTNSGGIDAASYEQVYLAFGFPASEFATRLKAFYDEFVKSAPTSTDPNNIQGFFNPSQLFNQWFEKVRDDYLASKTASGVSLPSADRLDVIDRILRLLVSMIDVLQRISAAQAQRLTFLTNWQQAYTTMLVDIPVFSKGSEPTGIGVDSDAAQTVRQDTATVTQTHQENIKALRTSVQDEAKQMQTTINQSQDAANQQTNMATSILQQLSTILSQIFR